MEHFLDEYMNEKTVELDWAREAIVERLFPQVLERSGLIGLDDMLQRMIQALLLSAHALLEGNPGLGKTEASESIAQALGLDFKRAQFTPDMLPSDIVGSDRITVDKNGKQGIEFCYGPGFTNILLGDEINRSSPKSQALLLELCAEQKASIPFKGDILVRPKTPIDEAGLLEKSDCPFGIGRVDPHTKTVQQFTVFATMNPIEQEGVYPLAEAQLDRFLFKLLDNYPDYTHLDRISGKVFKLQQNGNGSGKSNETERKERHKRTLAFLAKLREAIFSEAALDWWKHQGGDSPQKDLRTKALDFLDCTHGTGLDDGDNLFRKRSKKQEELKDRLTKGRNRHTRNREVKQLLDKWPHILSGASPRAIILCVRAAFAEAFWNGRIEEYTWRKGDQERTDLIVQPNGKTSRAWRPTCFGIESSSTRASPAATETWKASSLNCSINSSSGWTLSGEGLYDRSSDANANATE